MGRELKRVAMDFEWPLNVVWKGYICPYRATECNQCGGSGQNKETKKISDDWYTHSRTDGQEGWQYHLEQSEVDALIAKDRLWSFTRVPVTEEQREVVRKKIEAGGNTWLPKTNGVIPTAEEVNQWARTGFGHDSINQWIAVKCRAKRLGVYGDCRVCDGSGYYYGLSNWVVGTTNLAK